MCGTDLICNMSLVTSVHLISPTRSSSTHKTKQPSHHPTHEDKKAHDVSQDTPAMQSYKNSFDQYQAFCTSKEEVESGNGGRK